MTTWDKEKPVDPDSAYAAMNEAMHEGKHVMARKHALELWHWLCQGGDYPAPWSRTEVDASIRGVMLATEYLEEYEGWELDDDEEAGGRQLALF